MVMKRESLPDVGKMGNRLIITCKRSVGERFQLGLGVK